jgi:hypothetical protein
MPSRCDSFRKAPLKPRADFEWSVAAVIAQVQQPHANPIAAASSELEEASASLSPHQHNGPPGYVSSAARVQRNGRAL